MGLIMRDTRTRSVNWQIKCLALERWFLSIALSFFLKFNFHFHFTVDFQLVSYITNKEFHMVWWTIPYLKLYFDLLLLVLIQMWFALYVYVSLSMTLWRLFFDDIIRIWALSADRSISPYHYTNSQQLRFSECQQNSSYISSNSLL